MTTWATVNMYVAMLTHSRYKSSDRIPSTAGDISTKGMATSTMLVVALQDERTAAMVSSTLVGNMPMLTTSHHACYLLSYTAPTKVRTTTLVLYIALCCVL